MYSHLYRYLNIRTGSVTEYWSTASVERAILRSGLFTYGNNGSFKGLDITCNVNVLCVSDFEKFSENDYDPANANYVDIVISRDNSAAEAEEFFKSLAAELESEIRETEY